jgi:hypothetical protein
MENDMIRRVLAVLITPVIVVLLVPMAAFGQVRPSQAAAATWEPARTPWGDPDLQGTWNNVTGTPLERSVELKDKAQLTKEEAAAYEKRISDLIAARESTPVKDQSVFERTGYSAAVWFETGYGLSENRTSLLVRPEDGRLPPLTPEAQKILPTLANPFAGQGGDLSKADHPEDRGPYERCISRGLPGAMMPGFYNHNYQILQTPGFVVISVEMIHDARIIPMDGRSHVGSGIRQWLGDSRGRWEGNTLVVETTNFRDIGAQRETTVFGTTVRGRVIERFTRVSPDVIDYQVTVDDPGWYTQSWTAAIPMKKAQGPLYEYACHEGNYGLPNILAGHRQEEKNGAQKR